MITQHGYLYWLPPVTTNEGASSGPRISTAGYEWREKLRGAGWLVVRMYADLDGMLWQEDFDVSRRGAQAIVPFAKRAATAIRSGAAETITEPVRNQKGWYRTAVGFEDKPDGFSRRIRCHVEYPEEDARPTIFAEHERSWSELFAKIALTMGSGLHVSVNDNRNRKLFHGPAAA